MAHAGTVVVDVEAEASKFVSQLDSAAKRAGSSLVGTMSKAGKQVAADLASNAKAGAVALGVLAGAAIKVAADFNKAISGVGAVANATAGQLNQLREAALKAGADTSFSASQAADAEAELAKAGVSVNDILAGGLVGSLNLAAAGQLGLGDAATIAAQAMNLFHLKGQDVGHIADVLAAGANKSAADIGQLGDALRQGGLVAQQTGLSLEQTVGVLSAFADRALIGSDAGTSLKTMLQRLVPQGAPAAEAMKAIGFSAFDATGKFVGLESVAEQLKNGLSGLSDQQRQAALTTIFGSDAVRGATVLMNLGAAGIRDYTKAVNDQGAAQRVAAQQLDNLSGDVEVFKGSVETALIRLGDLGDGPLRDLLHGATDLVNAFDQFATTDAWDEINRQISRLLTGGDHVAGLGKTLQTVFGNIDVEDIDRFFATISRGVDKIHSVTHEFGALTDVAGGLGASIALMGARSLPVIGAFAPTLSPVTAVLGGLLVGTEGGRKGLESLGGAFKDIAKESGPEVVDSLGKVAEVAGSTLGSILSDLAPALADAANTLLPMLAQDLEDIAPAAGDFLASLAELGAEALPVVVDLISDIDPVLSAVGPLLHVAADGMGVLAHNADLLVPPLAAIVGYLKLRALLNGAGAIGGAAKAVKGFTTAAAEGGAVAALRGSVSGLTTSVGGLASALGPVGISVGATLVGLAVAQEKISEAKRKGDADAQDFLSQFTSIDDAGFTELQLNLQELSDMSDELGRKSAGALSPWRKLRLNETRDEIDKTADATLDEILASNRLGSELGITSSQAKILRDRQRELGKEFGTNSGLADEFRRALGSLRTTGQNVADSTDAAEQAVDDFTASLQLNGKTFDATTDAGRQNREAMSAVADKVRDLAASYIEQSGDVEGARQKTLGYVDGLRQTLSQAGLTDDEINQLLATYGLTPEQINTTIGLIGNEQAAAFVQKYQIQMDALPKEKQTQILALVNQGKLDEAKRLLDELTHDRHVNFLTHIITNPEDFPPAGTGDAGSLQRRILEETQGVTGANGMVLDFFGAGGVNERHVAQIAPAGSWRVWAEPETGGEAYIPLAASKRGRSVPIWKETGKRLGMFVDGGIEDANAYAKAKAELDAARRAAAIAHSPGFHTEAQVTEPTVLEDGTTQYPGQDTTRGSIAAANARLVLAERRFERLRRTQPTYLEPGFAAGSHGERPKQAPNPIPGDPAATIVASTPVGMPVSVEKGAVVVNPPPGTDVEELGRVILRLLGSEMAEEVYQQFSRRARSDRGFLTKVGAA